MSTSYPSSTATGSSSKAPAATAASLSAKRLFVGNLSESADEYTIIQFLSRYGKIAKFDFLFHKSGPKRGRPRGYAFVEYATAEVSCCRIPRKNSYETFTEADLSLERLVIAFALSSVVANNSFLPNVPARKP